MSDQGSQSKTVKSGETMFAIIEKLQEVEPAGVTDLADELGLAKSTVHAHLTTLKKCEYIVPDGRKYRLGLRFFDHGMHVRERLPLSRVSEPVLKQLAEETGEMTWLVVEEYGKAVYVRNVAGDRGVRTHYRVGNRIHLHYQAAGKAILAELPRERVDEIITKHGLPRRTDRTITDVDELYAELEGVRERGVAFNEEEERRNIRAIGAAVVYDDQVLGAVSISGPTNRLTGKRFREELPQALLGATNELELKLVYSQ